jgi:uncharacterized coiled-coil protein SlyX
MEQECFGQTVMDLAEETAVQAEVAHDRLALEWGHIVVSRILKMWKQIEAYESLAYEDKVAAQVRMIDEASSSLWHLHKALVRSSRTLKAHQQRLKRLKPPVAAAYTR